MASVSRAVADVRYSGICRVSGHTSRAVAPHMVYFLGNVFLGASEGYRAQHERDQFALARRRGFRQDALNMSADRFHRGVHLSRNLFYAMAEDKQPSYSTLRMCERVKFFED